MEEEEEEEDDDENYGIRVSGLSSHTSAVVFVVGGLQGSVSTVSAANSPFDPYNSDVLLAIDVVYNVGRIPSFFRETRKFLLLRNRLLPPPPAAVDPPECSTLLSLLGVTIGSDNRRRRRRREAIFAVTVRNYCTFKLLQRSR